MWMGAGRGRTTGGEGFFSWKRGYTGRANSMECIVKRQGENGEISRWQVRVIDTNPNADFGVCDLNLGNVKRSGGNHQRIE